MARGLTREEILEVAAGLVETEGLEALSMRRLAGELGVNPMTLYLRFESKEELLDHLAQRLVVALALPEETHGTWSERAMVWCRTLRSQLVANQALLPLLRTPQRAAAAFYRCADAGLQLAAGLGQDEADTVRAFRVLFWHTVGFSLVHDVIHREYPGGSDLGPADVIRQAVHHFPDRSLPALLPYVPHFSALDDDQLFDDTTALVVAGLWERRPAQVGGPKDQGQPTQGHLDTTPNEHEARHEKERAS